MASFPIKVPPMSRPKPTPRPTPRPCPTCGKGVSSGSAKYNGGIVVPPNPWKK